MRATVFVTAAVLVGSIVGRAQQPPSARAHDAGWTAPRDRAAQANPLASQPETVAGGKKVFQQRCSSCHGADAAGTADAPDLTRTAVRNQTDGALFWKITSGNTRSGMPTFSFLPPLQRWQLVLYIRSQAEKAAASSLGDR